MKTRTLFPLFARIKKTSKYAGQGMDEKRRQRLFPLDAIAGDGDGCGYIYKLMSNQYRVEDVDLFTWTPRSGLQSLTGKSIAAKDRLILEFDAISALLTREQAESVRVSMLHLEAAQNSVSEFIKAGAKLLGAKQPASGDADIEVVDDFVEPTAPLEEVVS